MVQASDFFKSMVREKDWQEQVEQMATLFNWAKYHTRDSRGSEEDFPDLILLRKNRCVVAELKKPGYYPTPGQLGWLDKFSEAGAETYVWWPHDFDEMKRVLR